MAGSEGDFAAEGRLADDRASAINNAGPSSMWLN
jgi:hypothetical protein